MDHLLKKREEIAAIKIMLASLGYQDLSISETIKYVMGYYRNLFMIDNNEKHLSNAILYIYAYLDMGFVYGEHKELFDQVFTLMQKKAENYIPDQLLTDKSQKKTSRNEIKSMIPRWSSSKYHSLSKEELIDDIINKVEAQDKGTYFYHSNQNPNKPEADDVYELVINEMESYLHDIRRSKFYRLYN